jgi:tetratricopeptide (TPR) repeat protein
MFESETALPQVPNPVTAMVERMINQLEPPEDHTITPEAQTKYKSAMDKANVYRGNLEVLWEALQLFRQADSLPLFYIGAAYAHVLGASVQALTHGADGLRAAQRWLQKAGEFAPEATELLVVQTFIHIHSGDFSRAYELLARLREVAPHDFYALSARLEYYAAKENEGQLTTTFQKTLPLAMTTTRRTYLLNRMGRYYWQLRMFDESLEMYRQLADLTPGDPSIWHNMSVNHLAKAQISQARRCNKTALQLMEFESGRHMQKKIRNTAVRIVFYKGIKTIGYALLVSVPWLLLVLAVQLMK